MRFEVEHVFEAPVEAVEAAMFHPDYYPFLRERHDVLNDVTPQSREEVDGLVKRRVLYKPRAVFEHIGPKRVPPHWFEFIEESTWDSRRRTLSFDNVPCTDKVARRFTNHGEIVLEQVAPGRTVRRAKAELKLHNLPLLLRPLGPLAEQMIAHEAKKLLAAEADVLHAFLEARHSERPPA
jgi:hypothetical protein